MSLRVTQDMSRDMLAALMELRRRENDALARVSSGRRLDTLSDDPAAAAALVGNHSEASRAGQILSNISSLRGSLQVADSALNSVVLALTRAITLGAEGANGTLSAENRQAVAEELSGIQQQLLTLVNVSFQGNYVFAGTAVTSPPFGLDAAAASCVRYQGNEGVNSLEVAPGQTLPTNRPGDKLFTDPAGDVFLALQHLIAAMQSGTNFEAANAEVQTAFARLNTQRAFYGTTLARLDMAESFVNQEKLELTRQEDALAGADLTQSASELVQTDNALQATMSAMARATQLTLLDYLK